MNSLYRILDNAISPDGQRFVAVVLGGTRRITFERDQQNIGVYYRDTRLITAYPNGDIRLTMHGWYTANSKEIMNDQLPPAIRVEFAPLPGAHELHKYAHVYLAQPDGSWVGQVLLEGTAGEGILVTPTTNNATTGAQFYAFTQRMPELGPLVEYNNRADDEIDRYLSDAVSDFFNSPAEMRALRAEIAIQLDKGHMMRPADVLRMIELGRLDAPVLLAAARYDSSRAWYAALVDMLGRQDVREVRNTLRVFLHWLLLTGPVMMRRGERPRPLSLEEWVTFDA